MLYIAGNSIKIGWLVPELQAVEGFAKQEETRRIFGFLFSYISKSVVQISNSLNYLITLQVFFHHTYLLETR